MQPVKETSASVRLECPASELVTKGDITRRDYVHCAGRDRSDVFHVAGRFVFVARLIATNRTHLVFIVVVLV